jgi:DNA-directed RNA polymerase delta subunit
MNNDAIKAENINNKKAKVSFFLALEKLFSELPERPQGIIKERYGIKNEKPKTLEEIGKEYKITRERVRQIIKETLKKLKKKRGGSIEEVSDELRFTLKEKSGIIKKDKLLSNDLDLKERGSLKFFLDLFDNIVFKEIPGELDASWAMEDFNVNEWRKVKNGVKEILEKNKNSLSDQELISKIKNSELAEFSQKKVFDYLDVSSEIKKGNFGKWGLEVWDEINPKGTREKIYLVFKETKKKPLHFKEIAILIDKYKLNKKKRTHPQTVHNELIRDKRFILVGRGIYALSEWGYKQGTVKEVIEDILRKNKGPMIKEEIIGKILDARKVKKSTIMINLNNFFERVGKNQYSIKK